jgi:hypothetical protein
MASDSCYAGSAVSHRRILWSTGPAGIRVHFACLSISGAAKYARHAWTSPRKSGAVCTGELTEWVENRWKLHGRIDAGDPR